MVISEPWHLASFGEFAQLEPFVEDILVWYLKTHKKPVSTSSFSLFICPLGTGNSCCISIVLRFFWIAVTLK